MTAPINSTGTTTIDNSTTAPVEIATAPAFANKADTDAQLAQAKIVEKAVGEVRNDDIQSEKGAYNAAYHAGFEADKAIRANASSDDVDMHVENQRFADAKKAALQTGVPMGQVAPLVVPVVTTVGKVPAGTVPVVKAPFVAPTPAPVKGTADEKTIALGGKPEGHATL